LKREFLRQDKTKEDLIDTIMEKWLSLDIYLGDGINNAQRDGLDVNSF